MTMPATSRIGLNRFNMCLLLGFLSCVSGMATPAPSNRCGTGLAGADAERLDEVEHEDLAVADLSGMAGVLDRLDDLLEQIVADRDLDLDLGQEAHCVFGPAIDLGLALLTPESLDLGGRHALDAERGQRLPHVVELERFDDGDNELHGLLLLPGCGKGESRFVPRSDDSAGHRQKGRNSCESER